MSLQGVRRALWMELDRLQKSSVLLWEELLERLADDQNAWMALLKVALRLPTPGYQLPRSQSAPSLDMLDACSEFAQVYP
jgi:hypothetical protein